MATHTFAKSKPHRHVDASVPLLLAAVLMAIGSTLIPSTVSPPTWLFLRLLISALRTQLAGIAPAFSPAFSPVAATPAV